jgi:hypothetical protein
MTIPNIYIELIVLGCAILIVGFTCKNSKDYYCNDAWLIYVIFGAIIFGSTIQIIKYLFIRST